jgi:hypothetical protein
VENLKPLTRDDSQVKSGANCIEYASDDKTLTCMLFVMTHSGDLKHDGYEEDGN